MFEQTKYVKYLHKIQIRANTLIDEMKALPGGDGYIFVGSSNQVEDLREALEDLEGYLINTDREDLY
jgi:hypothetical protein